MALQKISFKVPQKLWKSFATQANNLFLNRAPFLNHMIASETQILDTDLAGKVLTLRAKRHISGKLKLQGAASVNIEVQKSTAERLNTVVRKHNLVRDAFLCRLLIFLRGDDSLLDHLEVPRDLEDWRFPSNLVQMPTSPMKAMEAVRDDPFYSIRHHPSVEQEGGIYMVQLPRKLDWAACYLDDIAVPGTKAFKDDQRRSADYSDV